MTAATLSATERAWALLEHLSDPEIPVITLRELGILRDVRQGPDGLEVVITPTYSGCPAMGQIEDDVKAALAAEGLQARVVTQLAPAWTTDWMTDAARDKLRAYGIAPPHACASEKSGAANVVQFAARGAKPEVVNCPQCGSANTTETSHFGSTAMRFHDLTVSRVSPEAAGAVAITLHVPAELREEFAFQSGQFLTLRATIGGADVRRSYSISSARSQLQRGELEVGIRPVEGGVFSNWAASALRAGDTLRVMPPDGRFVVQRQRAIHRVGFAAGSGITPILSILASTLEEQPDSKFTLVYGNRRMDSVMFNEALQDLKDRYPSRLTLIHILSRQAQEVPLLEGRIDGDKVRAIIDAFLPVGSMDEVFICGPEAMIEATEQALLGAGVSAKAIRTERFTSPTLEALTPEQRAQAVLGHKADRDGGEVQLTVVLDGKPYDMPMNKNEKILDIALALGLDLPYSCKGGVCCTCRCKVVEGSTEMDKNFTLEKPEVDAGFVLSCQARPTSGRVVVSFDER